MHPSESVHHVLVHKPIPFLRFDRERQVGRTYQMAWQTRQIIETLLELFL